VGKRKKQSRADVAAQHTVRTLVGGFLLIIVVFVAYAALRGVQDTPTVIIDDDGCLYQQLTPSQLATSRWWETCE
jgi:hypothetical protein